MLGRYGLGLRLAIDARSHPRRSSRPSCQGSESAIDRVCARAPHAASSAARMNDLEPLLQLLRIPSISADPAHAADLQRALEWVAAFVERCGGSAAIVDGSSGRLAGGDVPAGAPNAPTVLLYGHVDVQPPAPLELW